MMTLTLESNKEIGYFFHAINQQIALAQREIKRLDDLDKSLPARNASRANARKRWSDRLAIYQSIQAKVSDAEPSGHSTLEHVKGKIAGLRPHFHAISLHADCLDEGELADHAWELACGIDKLDLELTGERIDKWLEEAK